MSEYASTERDPLSVFVNSKLEAPSNTTANDIQFSFHEPVYYESELIPHVKLLNFQTMNTFANISAAYKNNQVQIVNLMYNQVTKVYDDTSYRINITIPDSHYSIDTLFAFLNAQCNKQVNISGQNWTTYNGVAGSTLFLGLGFSGTGSPQSSSAVPGFAISGSDTGLACFFPPWWQGNTNGNPYQKYYTTTAAQDLTYYAGVYLIVNDDTAGFMTMLGFITPGNYPGAIYNSPSKLQGVGFSFPVTPAVNPVAPLSFTTGPLVFNTFTPSLIYFTVDQLSSNSRCSDEVLDQKNILGTIILDEGYGRVINYENKTADGYVVLKSDVQFTSLTVSLYDENARKLDFRGGRWAATLHFIFMNNERNKTFTDETAMTSNQYNMHPGLSHGLTQQLNRPHRLGGASVQGGLRQLGSKRGRHE